MSTLDPTLIISTGADLHSLRAYPEVC